MDTCSKHSNKPLPKRTVSQVTALNISTQINLLHPPLRSSPMIVPDPYHPWIFHNLPNLAWVLPQPSIASPSWASTDLYAFARILLTYLQPTQLLPTYPATHRPLSQHIQPLYPIRPTFTLQAWTRWHIWYISLVPSVYLTLFHPNHFQHLGPTYHTSSLLF